MGIATLLVLGAVVLLVVVVVGWRTVRSNKRAGRDWWKMPLG